MLLSNTLQNQCTRSKTSLFGFVLLFVFSHLLPVKIHEGFNEPQGVDAAIMERGPDKVGGVTGAAGFDRLALQQPKRQVLLG
jgi:hypothetical protein